MRFFIQLAYEGEAYCGWQIQPNGISVQETLEKALSLTARTPIQIVGQGRTDAGVHALDTYAHFDIEQLPYSTEQWAYKLNSLLPHDIAIKRIIPVHPEAHARFTALSRSYRYVITTTKNPFYHKRAWYISRPLDIERIQQAMNLIKGKHDFTSFSSARSEIENRVCNVTELCLSHEYDFIYIDITADRFVMNMVRTIVGTLVEIGSGKRKVENIPALFAAQNRQKAGENAPPYGLYLREVKYPELIFTI